MRHLLLGGTGTIGIAIMRQLLAANEHVACMDYMPNREALQTLKGADVPIYQGDMSNLQTLLDIIAQEKPDTIINLAYLMSTPTSEHLYGSATVNVVGIANIFEAARLMGVRRVVYASSVAVYGDSQSYYGDRPVNEDDSCPSWNISRIYAATKVMNEQFALRYAEKYDLELISARPCIILAPGRESGRTATIARIIHWPPQGKSVVVPFRRSMPVCVQYAEDTARVMAGLACKEKLSHAAYNTGGHVTTLGEICDTVKRFIPDADITFTEDGKDHTLITWPDDTRIKEELGITFPSLETTVKAIIDATAAK